MASPLKRWFLRTTEVMNLGADFGNIPINSEPAVKDLLVSHFAGTSKGVTLAEAHGSADDVIIRFQDSTDVSFWVKSRKVTGYLLFE